MDELRVVQQVAQRSQSRQLALLLRPLQLREQLRHSQQPEGHRSPAGIHRSAALAEKKREENDAKRLLSNQGRDVISGVILCVEGSRGQVEDHS